MVKLYLLNQVAIITGASSGIGHATALELARNGAKVVLAARNTVALQKVAQQVQTIGREALVVTTDIEQPGQVDRLVKDTLAHWGKVDILIANAGQYIRSPIANLSITDIEHSMAVNFYGEVYAVLSVLPHLLAQHSGHIVLVSSMDAKTCLPPDAPYVAAKCALNGFGDVLRQELYQTGVFTSLVCPGRVDSPMIEHLRVPWMSAKISPETVARAIVRAIRRRQPEVIVPAQSLLLYFFRFISPALMDRAVRLFHLEGWES